MGDKPGHEFHGNQYGTVAAAYAERDAAQKDYNSAGERIASAHEAVSRARDALTPGSGEIAENERRNAQENYNRAGARVAAAHDAVARSRDDLEKFRNEYEKISHLQAPVPAQARVANRMAAGKSFTEAIKDEVAPARVSEHMARSGKNYADAARDVYEGKDQSHPDLDHLARENKVPADIRAMGLVEGRKPVEKDVPYVDSKGKSQTIRLKVLPARRAVIDNRGMPDRSGRGRSYADRVHEARLAQIHPRGKKVRG